MIRPARGLALVRPVETEHTLPGGKILIPDQAREKLASHQVQIVAVGEPEICEDEDCRREHGAVMRGLQVTDALVHTCSAREGDWAIVQPRSFVPAAPDGEKLYFVRQSEILGVFRLDNETKPGN